MLHFRGKKKKPKWFIGFSTEHAGAATFSRMTFGRTTLGRTTLSRMAFSRAVYKLLHDTKW